MHYAQHNVVVLGAVIFPELLDGAMKVGMEKTKVPLEGER